MKKRIVFVVVICFLFGIKAFAQCIVSGGNLKDSLQYQTVQQMQDDVKNIKKAAKKDGTSFNIIIPEKSKLANISSINKIANEVFDGIEINLDEYDNQCFKYSKQVSLSVTRKQSKFYVTGIKDLVTKAEAAKIEEEKKAATQKEREEITGKIKAIKEESEKSFSEKELLKCKELGYKETTFDSAAEKYEKNKNFIFALKIYYEKSLLAKQELQDFNVKVQNMFQATEKVYTKWDNTYSRIKPVYADNKYENLLKRFETGNPWTYEYDADSRYADWKILTKDFEQYFLENPVFSVHYIDLKKSSENKANNSFVYKCNFEIDDYIFYQTMVNRISMGIRKAWKDSWTDISKEWIKNSPACHLDYEIKIDIVDTNGKVLVKGDRFAVASTNNYVYMGQEGVKFGQTNSFYEFKDIPDNVAALIEEGNAFVRLDSLYVKYGPSDKKAEITIPKSKVSEYNRTKVFNSAKGEFDNIDVKL
jgi:hypothetical protein